MKRLFTLLFFFAALAAHAQSGYQISGRITDASTQEPLPGANILIKGTNRGTVSDANGYYSLRLAAGSHSIYVSFVGYEAGEQQVTGAGQVNFALNPSKAYSLGVLDIYGNKVYPVTKTDIDQGTLEKQNLGQDLPVLLNFTPSVVATSDAGAGVGYTGMRIRGSDAERINVTINGIPLNDSESQGVFWVNMPDFASSVGNISIQRGVGTSTNGAGAFGASVNLTTAQPSETAFAEWNGSVGSFNTWKNNVEFGTGRIENRLSVTGRLSKVTSDGFIDKASADLKSFYLSGNYRDEKLGSLTFNVFSGKEITFQAWNGVPEERLLAGDRTYNELAGYDNEVDNYQQDHYQLLYDKQLNGNWSANVALHYTRGRGYFEQYKADERLSSYGLAADGLFQKETQEDELGNPIEVYVPITRSDIIRRRWLDNHFYGGVYSVSYRKDKLDWVLGGGWNRYEGKHFGEVIWAKVMGNGNIRQRYYDNDATKTDFNAYTKATYEVAPSLFLFADLQVRRVNYAFEGINDNGAPLQQEVPLAFFNPKAGMRYEFGNHALYGTFGIGNKEPNRNDFTDNPNNARPLPEQLRNLEVGYSGRLGKSALGVNFYWMDYKNQLVLTGKINDVGAYTRTNIAKSYRMGVELQWKTPIIEDKLSWEANATFSDNRIPNFVEYIDDYDADFNFLGQQAISHGKSHIALSPSVIAGSQWVFKPAKQAEIALLSKFVGKQYLDNTSSEQRMLDPYFVNDLRMSYAFSAESFKHVSLTLLVNNMFNHLYESNGYTYGWLYSGARDTYNYYYPQAGRNFLFGVKLRI